MDHAQQHLEPSFLIFAKIDHLQQDAYQQMEEWPSPDAVQTAKRLIESASIPSTLASPDISADSEELDVTWHQNGKFLRLITYSNGRRPRVYFHVDSNDIFTRGQSVEAVESIALSEKLEWLSH